MNQAHAVPGVSCVVAAFISPSLSLPTCSVGLKCFIALIDCRSTKLPRALMRNRNPPLYVFITVAFRKQRDVLNRFVL